MLHMQQILPKGKCNHPHVENMSKCLMILPEGKYKSVNTQGMVECGLVALGLMLSLRLHPRDKPHAT